MSNSDSFQAAAANLAITVMKEGVSQLYGPLDATITVYDALKSFVTDANFSRTTEVTDIKANYTYGWYENIDFMYVKKLGEADDKQKLTFTSSAVYGNISWTIPEFSYKSNGAVQKLSFNTDQRPFSYYNTTAHRNGSFAVAAYLDPSAPRNAYITWAEMRGFQNKLIKTVPVATPASPFVM
ncbi:hypothetical protein [Cohnella sp. REN36]|uniref:hypothetical protein n=1 Tax=Cohnella sp. REN36 TaxID=2887347 RepID=UPI001D140637|nr:hypothetical protein [Cohnella sp. REN36]MCC3372380.1 hypothetical protein [Cohnella sp. REN36]